MWKGKWKKGKNRWKIIQKRENWKCVNAAVADDYDDDDDSDDEDEDNAAAADGGGGGSDDNADDIDNERKIWKKKVMRDREGKEKKLRWTRRRKEEEVDKLKGTRIKRRKIV